MAYSIKFIIIILFIWINVCVINAEATRDSTSTESYALHYLKFVSASVAGAYGLFYPVGLISYVGGGIITKI